MRFGKRISCQITRCVIVLGLSVFAAKAGAFPASFSVGPDSSQQLLLHELQTVEQEEDVPEQVLINAYEFRHPDIRDALLRLIDLRDASGRPTKIVQMLVEGQPVGGITVESVAELQELQDRMDEANKALDAHNDSGDRDFIRVMDELPKSLRRYVWDHAKYMVIDAKWILVSSDNFVLSGFPEPGFVGHRGWQVVLEDPQIAKQLIDVFRQDALDNSHNDVNPFPTVHLKPLPDVASNPVARTLDPFRVESGDVANATLITSPENSKQDLKGVIGSATRTLDVETASLPLDWKDSAKQPVMSDLVASIVKKAEEKPLVQVRVLLNDDTVYSGDDPTARKPNKETVDYLNCLNLPNLEARIVNIGAMRVDLLHNKGMLVDGVRAVVGSINGTQNSIEKNREVDLRLESSDAAAYFGRVFTFDWGQSPSIKGMESCPPALITQASAGRGRRASHSAQYPAGGTSHRTSKK